MYEMKAGNTGSTQGETKLKNPAPNARKKVISLPKKTLHSY